MPEQQGIKLWKHVLFGTGTCIGMIEGYARQEMPGDPREGIVQLRNRLNDLLEVIDRQPRNDSDPDAEEAVGVVSSEDQ